MSVIKKQGHLVLPLVSLIGLMFTGFTPLYAAVISIFITVAASWLRKETRMTGDKIIAAVIEGARSAVSVGVCCVIIGVIIGTVTLTSMGLHMGYLILSLLQDNHVYLAGFLVMIMSAVLGMGVPGVAAYVIVQAVAVPVLIKAGVLPLIAHMFCLIYACLSNITPPVAMSAYVASGIAGSDQTKTGLMAVRLGLIGFIIPFFFLDNPVLLIGVDPAATAVETLWAVFSAAVGTCMPRREELMRIPDPYIHLDVDYSAAETKAEGEVGLAFQIRDDMLDVVGDEQVFGKPIGSDKEEGKITYVDVDGLEGCARAVEACTRRAKDAVAQWPDHDFLFALADQLVGRNK